MSSGGTVHETTWAEMPSVDSDPTRRVGSRLARVLIPFVIGAVLLLVRLTVAGILVLIAATVLLALTFFAPDAAARVEHWFGRFGQWVGHALGVVLLGLVDLLVFTPIAFVLWLVRYDPLAPGVSRDARSFWHAHTGRALPARPYADERSLFAPATGGDTYRQPRPVLRLATVIGVVSLLLLADLGAGWVYDEVSSATHGTPAVADDTFDPSAQPAFRDAPWAAELLAEQATLPGVRDTYLGYRLDSLTRKYTNVVDGARVSYEQPGDTKKLTVWFFGGSAMFGDGQRDEHTIPSEFARLAEAEGIPVEVRNYGRPGIAMWQELELYEQLVGSGEQPDLVVFYDGFNDLAWQLNVLLTTVPVNVYDANAADSASAAARQQISADIAATKARPRTTSTAATSPSGFEAVVDAYWDQAGSRRVYDAVDEVVNGSDAPKTQFAKGVQQHATSSAPADPQNIQAAKNAVAIQKRASRLAAAVAAGQGADSAFFWQPNAFTKQLLPDEQPYTHMDLYEAQRWVPAVTEARKLLRGSRFVDLGSALDGAGTPVLWDFVHTNEEGARLVAAAMLDSLRPKLEKRLAGAPS